MWVHLPNMGSTFLILARQLESRDWPSLQLCSCVLWSATVWYAMVWYAAMTLLLVRQARSSSRASFIIFTIGDTFTPGEPTMMRRERRRACSRASRSMPRAYLHR